MELSFIVKAVRRYWWLFLGLCALGVVPAMMFDTTSEPYHESRAIVLVSPPSESRVQVNFNDPDRYVLGQLSLLRSDALADRVAIEIGEGATADSVLRGIDIIHEPDTDVVEIVAKNADPERARIVAQSYVDMYFDSLRSAVDETQGPELEKLSADLESLRQRIALVDTALADAIAPYIPNPGVLLGGQSYPPIPALDSVSPALVSQKEALLEEYNQVLSTKTSLELNGKLRVTSQIVQPATLSTVSVIDQNRFLGAAGLLAGAFLGLLACVSLLRLSTVSDDMDEVAAMLGGAFVGRFPRIRALARTRRAAVEQLPSRAAAMVDEVCVRAEANASPGQALTVLVAGTERSSGCTTLAASLANRYAANGSQVLLIDVDPRDSELTRLFAPATSGIAGLLALDHELADAGRGPRPRDGFADPFSATTMPGLTVIGIGDKTGVLGFRRQHVPQILAIAAHHGHVVVFDGGPMMDAASTMQLAQLVDTLVMAVPDRRQPNRVLSVIAAQLRGRRGELLLVAMPARRNRSRSKEGAAGRSPAVELAVEPDLVAPSS